MGMSMAGATISLRLYDALESENPWVPLPDLVNSLRSQFVSYTLKLSSPAKRAGISPLGISQSVDEVDLGTLTALSWEELRSRESKFTVDEVAKLLLMKGVRNNLYEEREFDGVKEYSASVNGRN